MDNLPFFTDENKDLLYSLCRDEIYKTKQYNIDSNKKYYKTFGEIMKIVYKHSKNVNDISTLNKEVLSKTIPYLNQEINKKQLNNNAMLPPNILRNQEVKRYENLAGNQSSNNGLPVSFRAAATNIEHENLSSVNNNFDKLMSDRDSMFAKPTPPKVDFGKTNLGPQESPSVLMEQNIKAREEINKKFNIPNNNNNINQGIDNNAVKFNSQPNPLPEVRKMHTQDNHIPIRTDELAVQNFELPEELVRDLHNQDTGSNIIKDLNTYDSRNDNVNPMELLNQYQETNKQHDNEYQNIQNSRDSFESANREENFNLKLQEDQLNLSKDIEEHHFKDSMTFKLNQEMENTNVDTLKGQFDHRMTQLNASEEEEKLPEANDTSIIQNNQLQAENSLFEELKKKLFKERTYVNKENLVIINSADRDWFNNANYNRYSFQVRFNPEIDSIQRVPKMNGGQVERAADGSIIYEDKQYFGDQGAGIQTIFKNIVSFELVRVLMPVENFIIPFDNRIFIDYKSLPYIVLRIDEIEGLYAGTNANTNRSFAQLLWDKDQTSEVVIDTGILNGDKKTYSRQLKRGFSSMAPMSFEKKTFYPTPLSSLNRLTIALETPYGKSLLNHTDTLTIKNINLLNLTNTDILDLDESTGFPYQANDDIIQIETTNYFNNRVFKIGDNIKIKGFVSSQSDTGITADFINQEDGHYIINLEKETNTQASTTSNEGYINKIYIAPPGKFNVTSTNTSIISNQASLSSDVEIYAAGAGTGVGISTGDTEVDTPASKKPSTVLNVGDAVTIDGQIKTVVSIDDDNDKFLVNSVFTGIKTNQAVTRHRREYLDETVECKLINKSIQSHYVFKIVTREEDIHSHMLSSNV